MKTKTLGNYFEANNTLKDKNTALSKKCEEFRVKMMSAKKNVENLKDRRQSTVRTVVALKVDGLIDIDDQVIADRCFVDIAYIKNTKSIIKRERK